VSFSFYSIFLFISPSTGRSGDRCAIEPLQSLNDIIRIKPARIVHINVDQAKGAVAIYKKRARNRQLAFGAFAIGRFERMAEVPIQFNEIIA
jgi:hypothetical protein